MEIHGFIKTTLLDYPGHLAATIFTGKCNFRCPFCHNKDLVLHSKSLPFLDSKEILHYLKRRVGILDGVCITGGEPTLQPDLEDFIRQIKELGLLIKLDTNGYRPVVLQSLIDQKLVDYVAMDIKNSFSKYSITCGISDINLSQIEESIHILLQNQVPYEFRTTISKELHSEQDIIEIGHMLQGAQAYFLQNYKDSPNVISQGFTPCTQEKIIHYIELLKPFIPFVKERGQDR